MGYIKTFSGILIDPLNPDPSLIRFGDIVVSLSRLQRWTGHLGVDYYSVGLHSLCVYSEVCKLTTDVFTRRWALLHDGSEAYFNDLARPVKRGLADYKQYEMRFQQVLGPVFGLPPEIPEVVHHVDWQVLLMEARDLFSCPSFPQEYGETKWPETRINDVLYDVFLPGAARVRNNLIDFITPKAVRQKMFSLYPGTFTVA